MARTLLNPNQIRLNLLFSVDRILQSRGYKIYQSATTEVTLLGRAEIDEQTLDQLFQCFLDRSNRNEILHAINEKSNLKNDFLLKWPLLQFPKLDRERFSATIEWSFGELLIRKFQSFSSAFGVKIQALTVSDDVTDIGDFDVLSVMGDTGLLYVECKSGGTNLEQIQMAARRGQLLGAKSTIIALESKTGNYQRLKSLLENEQHPNYKFQTSVFEIESIRMRDSSAIIWGNLLFLPLASSNLENSLATLLRLDHHLKARSYEEAIYSGSFSSVTEQIFSARGFRIRY